MSSKLTFHRTETHYSSNVEPKQPNAKTLTRDIMCHISFSLSNGHYGHGVNDKTDLNKCFSCSCSLYIHITFICGGVLVLGPEHFSTDRNVNELVP